MKIFQRLCCTALCAALALPLGAFAADGPQYPDLSPDHWAYTSISQAVSLGILKGMEDGRMAPDDVLTWDQKM